MPIPLPLYTDGRSGSVQVQPLATGTSTMDVASAVGAPRFGAPFAGDAAVYKLEQDFMQFTANYSPLALNTAHPDYATYYLTGEGALSDAGGGISKWTRTYCSIPVTRNDYTSMAYAFIGYFGQIASLATDPNFPVVGRPRQTRTVTCRVQNDYFLCAAGQTYTTPSAIPIILATKYYIPQGSVTVSTGIFIYAYPPPGSTSDMNNGTDTDLIWDPAAVSGIIPTVPSRTTYQGWINAGTELVAQASVISRWAGNIYQRQTKYVIAQ